jgi:hypothetical protein
MKKILFLFLVIFCCYNVVPAQTSFDEDSVALADEDDVPIEQADTVQEFMKPVLRQMSNDSLNALKHQKEFAYMQYIDSVFRNHKYPEQEIIKEKETEEKPGFFLNPGLRTLYWLLAFAAVIWIAFKLFFGTGSIFASNRKLRSEKIEDETVLDDNVSMEYLVDKAISERNYRLATRYLYLQTLALLGENDMISLAPQKTNYQYLQELKGKTEQAAFSTLTLQYEYAWYGGFALSPSQFEKIYKGFQNFITDLK